MRVSMYQYRTSSVAALSLDLKNVYGVPKTHKKLVIAIDEAHSAAEWLPILLIRLNRLRQRNVHFLLCSRTIDWRAEADEMGIITRESDYQEISLGGLSKEDALQVINAWTAFGRDGLRNLQNMDPAKAAETLYEAAKDQDTDQEEGAFLGAMLRLRYGDSLKDKVRSILYRLKDIEAPGGTLLDAYALIAAMHNEGLRFLSLPVLAEALNCPQNEAQRKIVNPLADEAIAAGGGRFVLCRHKAIAQATVTVLKETNLYGEIDASFASLSRAAVIARQKGLYVPDLHKWDYALPEHFSSMGRKAIAIAAAEGMQLADPDDIRLRVNLSKIYRETDLTIKAAELFRNYSSDKLTRIAWHEWSVAERECGEILPSIILAAIGICDIPGHLAPTRVSAVRSLDGMGICFQILYKQYGDPSYIQAIMLVAQISMKLTTSHPEISNLGGELRQFALARGATEYADKDLISSLAAIVEAIVPMVKYDLLIMGRVPRADLVKYDGLAALLRR